MSSGLDFSIAAKNDAGKRPKDNCRNLSERGAGKQGNYNCGEECDRRSRTIGRECLRHTPHRLGNDCNCHHLEPVDHARSERARQQ
jgi:hypothetical protein